MNEIPRRSLADVNSSAACVSTTAPANILMTWKAQRIPSVDRTNKMGTASSVSLSFHGRRIWLDVLMTIPAGKVSSLELLSGSSTLHESSRSHCVQLACSALPVDWPNTATSGELVEHAKMTFHDPMFWAKYLRRRNPIKLDHSSIQSFQTRKICTVWVYPVMVRCRLHRNW